MTKKTARKNVKATRRFKARRNVRRTARPKFAERSFAELKRALASALATQDISPSVVKSLALSVAFAADLIAA